MEPILQFHRMPASEMSRRERSCVRIIPQYIGIQTITFCHGIVHGSEHHLECSRLLHVIDVPTQCQTTSQVPQPQYPNMSLTQNTSHPLITLFSPTPFPHLPPKSSLPRHLTQFTLPPLPLTSPLSPPQNKPRSSTSPSQQAHPTTPHPLTHPLNTHPPPPTNPLHFPLLSTPPSHHAYPSPSTQKKKPTNRKKPRNRKHNTLHQNHTLEPAPTNPQSHHRTKIASAPPHHTPHHNTKPRTLNAQKTQPNSSIKPHPNASLKIQKSYHQIKQKAPSSTFSFDEIPASKAQPTSEPTCHQCIRTKGIIKV